MDDNSLVLSNNKMFQDMLLSALCGDSEGMDSGKAVGAVSISNERADIKRPMDDPIAHSTNIIISAGAGACAGVGSGVCLISGDPLEPRHVKLNCGHTFNYENIFNEVYRQKKVYQKYENTILRMREIKCPYCRNVQSELLFEDARFPRVTGVNAPSRFCMYPAKCQYVLEDSGVCNAGCYETYCLQHMRLLARIEKLKQKLELKEQKALMKTTKKAHTQASVITLVSDSTSTPIQKSPGLDIPEKTSGCCAVLKNGANKGLMCGAKIKYMDTGLCGRHGSNLLL